MPDKKENESKPFGCSNPTGSKPKPKQEESKILTETKEIAMEIAGITKKAPDFEVPAFHQGKFINLKLSEHFGKWIVLCFYPGDFTFV